MRHKLATGTIRRTIPARDRPECATHVVVESRGGRYKAILGPGLYKNIKVADLPTGSSVYLVLDPIPTVMGKIKDGSH